MGVGLSGLSNVGKILLYGILFNLVFVGVPFCIDALKADNSRPDLAGSVDVWLQGEFKRNPPEVNWTDPVLAYSMLLGWIVVCGIFVDEARRYG